MAAPAHQLTVSGVWTNILHISAALPGRRKEGHGMFQHVLHMNAGGTESFPMWWDKLHHHWDGIIILIMSMMCISEALLQKALRKY
jgi:hypothetical protein